jgi:glycosyltransferase involved in cell wall biosynthesis
MSLAFYLDNRAICALGPLPSPSHGNPGIGGTEYVFLAVVELLQGSSIQPLLFLTAPQSITGIYQSSVRIVSSLSQALDVATKSSCEGFVFRPGFASSEDWLALENCEIPLLPWLHNLGCLDQARYEALPTIRFWLLVSRAQLDSFRHSRLSHRSLVVPNPVAVPSSVAQNRVLLQATRATDLAYVGALTPFKGFDRLARLWPSIAKLSPDTKLRVFGGSSLYTYSFPTDPLSPYELYCQDLLQRGGYADRVVFEGVSGLDRYVDYQHLAVGLVNPTGRDETFCLAAAEFSACGIPVVAPRRNALIQTVLHQRTGLLFAADHGLVDSVLTLLQDPRLALSYGLCGQQHVRAHYSAPIVQAAWLDVFKKLVEKQPITSPSISVPWWHEHLFLRRLWGLGFFLPFWPSWPAFKALLKRFLQGGGEFRPFGVGMAAAFMALIVWFALVFGKFDGNPTGLARIGDRFPVNPHLPPEQLLVLPNKRGNDGQQFLVLATDPLQLDPATPQAVDNPIYRGKRLLYPLLAWITGLGQPQLIVWTLGLLNVGCIACAAGLVAQWAQLEQRNPRWGLAVLALPGYWITLTLSTADLLATMLLLAAAVAWRRRRLGLVAGALSAAVLTRETALLAWAATGLTTLWELRWRWLPPLALVPVPLLALTASLKSRFAATSDGLLATLHFGPPGLGTVQKALELLGLRALPGPPLVGFERCFDALCLLFWLATLIVLAATALRGWGGRWLRFTAALYLLPALCTSTQILARFPDYTRVWIDLSTLALLALLSARSRWLLWWVGGAAVLSVGYGLGFWWLT